MTEKKYKVIEIEPKVSKNNRKYWRVNLLDEGWCSCFEEDIIDKIKSGNEYIFELAETDKGFKNIRKLIEESKEIKEKEIKDNKTFDGKNTTMYTSYAKDIFIGLLGKLDKNLGTEEIMEIAIETVNKARRAFS